MGEAERAFYLCIVIYKRRTYVALGLKTVFGNLQGGEAGMSWTWLMLNDRLCSRVSYSALGMLNVRRKTHVKDIIGCVTVAIQHTIRMSLLT